jgi:ABC-type glycerol-3-phosphate transport system permease component
MMRILSKFIKAALTYVVGATFAVFFAIPLLWVLSSSFKSDKEIYSTESHFFPVHPTLSHYLDLVSALPRFPVYMLNSAVVTVLSVAGVVLIAALAGYPLARFSFRGRSVVFSCILLAVAIPYVLYLVPIYVIESNTNLLNSIPGLVLPYIALNLPLAIVLMEGTYRTIPRDFEDAAAIDGCSPLRAWWSIILPLAGPGVASVVIFTFVAVWEEFMFAVTLFSSGNNTTFPVGITYLQAEGQSYAFGQLCATIVLALTPPLVMFLLLQRHFVKGLLEGGVKG